MRLSIIFSIIFCSILSACEEYHGLYVDDSCTDREYELIQKGVERFNAVVTDDNAVSLMGFVDASSDDRVGTGDGSRDVVFCFDSNEDDKAFENHIGKVENDDILMSRYVDSDGCWLGTFMHELGHYAAGAWHVSDDNSIMFRKSTCITQYSEHDIAEFRRQLGL